MSNVPSFETTACDEIVRINRLLESLSERAREAEAREKSMIEALRFAVAEAETYGIEALTLTLRNKLEELEAKR